LLSLHRSLCLHL